MTPGPLELGAAVTTAVAAALLARALVPPAPRLRALIHVAPAAAQGSPGGPTVPGQGGRWRPADRLLAVLNALTGGERLGRRLRQVGATRGRGEAAAVLEHHLGVLGAAAAHAGLGVAVVAALGARPTGAVAAGAVFAVAGAARRHGRLDRTLEERRRRIQVELYTVNQLLALDVRAGGGVAQAIERIARRGHGVLAEDLGDVLAATRAGLPLGEALEQAAELSPEPAASRTYRLLAKGARFGTDLGTGLRALNEDLRVQRAEALERVATKRRAAMLIPLIGLLAPVMLLFIAAPLPAIVFGME